MATYNPAAWENVPGFANHFDKFGWVDYRQNLIDWLTGLHPRPSSILDVGCCRGEYLLRLREEGYAGRLQGCDITPQCVAGAKAAGLAVTQADCRALPLADQSHDAVLFANVLMHLPEPVAPLAEVCRVAKKHVILSCYGSPDELRSKHTRQFLNWFYPKQTILDAMPEGWKLEDFATFINPFGTLIYQYKFARETKRKKSSGKK